MVCITCELVAITIADMDLDPAALAEGAIWDLDPLAYRARIVVALPDKPVKM